MADDHFLPVGSNYFDPETWAPDLLFGNNKICQKNFIVGASNHGERIACPCINYKGQAKSLAFPIGSSRYAIIPLRTERNDISTPLPQINMYQESGSSILSFEA